MFLKTLSLSLYPYSYESDEKGGFINPGLDKSFAKSRVLSWIEFDLILTLEKPGQDPIKCPDPKLV